MISKRSAVERLQDWRPFASLRASMNQIPYKPGEPFDAIIIGAGPAGSFLGHQLAKNGLKTIILEKSLFPRVKPCAGGIPVKVVNLLPFDISEVVEKEIFGISLVYKLRSQFSKKYEKPLIYTVKRDKLDAFLVKKAVEVGVIFLDQEEVVDIWKDGEIGVVQTKKQKYKGRVVVGADGANSIVSKKLLMKPYTLIDMGIQCEIPLEDTDIAQEHTNIINLDWGSIPKSYGWVFPKKDRISIGIKGPIHFGEKLRSYFNNHLKYYNFEYKTMVNFSGHLIPYRIEEKPIQKDNFILVGDAAGLADSWTGEGIYYGLASSLIAALMIREFLEKEIQAFRIYEEIVNKQIMPELITAYKFSKIFNYSPYFFFKIIEKTDYFWDLFCRTIRGDRTFFEIKQRLRFLYIAKKLFFLSIGNPIIDK